MVSEYVLFPRPWAQLAGTSALEESSHEQDPGSVLIRVQRETLRACGKGGSGRLGGRSPTNPGQR